MATLQDWVWTATRVYTVAVFYWCMIVSIQPGSFVCCTGLSGVCLCFQAGYRACRCVPACDSCAQLSEHRTGPEERSRELADERRCVHSVSRHLHLVYASVSHININQLIHSGPHSARHANKCLIICAWQNGKRGMQRSRSFL